jgi:hypothetical protein
LPLEWSENRSRRVRDLGDRRHTYCVLDEAGKIAREGSLSNTREQLAAMAGSYPGATVVMEAGTHSPWVSRFLQELGLRAVVANPRKTLFQRPQLAMIMEGVASDHRSVDAVAVRVAHREAATVVAHGRRVERVDDDSLELAEEDDEIRRQLFKGNHDARAGCAPLAPALDPGMQHGGMRAHLPALNELSGAIEHSEIRVFVGSVDADKVCIRDVHGIGSFACVDGANPGGRQQDRVALASL